MSCAIALSAPTSVGESFFATDSLVPPSSEPNDQHRHRCPKMFLLFRRKFMPNIIHCFHFTSQICSWYLTERNINTNTVCTVSVYSYLRTRMNSNVLVHMVCMYLDILLCTRMYSNILVRLECTPMFSRVLCVLVHILYQV
jgi:hypothetical protein